MPEPIPMPRSVQPKIVITIGHLSRQNYYVTEFYLYVHNSHNKDQYENRVPWEKLRYPATWFAV